MCARYLSTKEAIMFLNFNSYHFAWCVRQQMPIAFLGCDGVGRPFERSKQQQAMRRRSIKHRYLGKAIWIYKLSHG